MFPDLGTHPPPRLKPLYRLATSSDSFLVAEAVNK